MESIYVELEKRKKPDGTWNLPFVISGEATFKDFFGDSSPMSVTDKSMESELNTLVIKNPIISYSSLTKYKFQITADVTIPNSGGWLNYPFLVGLTGKLDMDITIYGSICDFSGSVDLEGAKIGSSEINLLICNSLFYPTKNSYAGLEVILEFNELDTPVSFITFLFQDEKYWSLSSFFNNGLGVVDTSSFLLKLFSVEKLLLPANSPINNFKLYELTFGMNYIDKKDLSLQYIRTYLSSSEPWKMPLEFLTIDEISLMWEMQWGQDKGYGREYLYTGQIDITILLSLPNDFEIAFSATATLPEIIIEAHLQLDDEKTYTTGQLLGSATNTLPDATAGSITLASIDFFANPKNRELSVYAFLDPSSVLNFSLGNLAITLTKLYASANFYQTGNAFCLGGEIEFGDGDDAFSLALEGTYTSPKDGQSFWNFKGALATGNVKLGTLVLHMLKIEPGSGSEFDIVLSEFSVSYETLTKAFMLTAAFSAQWGQILGGLDVNASGKICVHSDKYGANKLAVMLSLSIQPFSASVQIDDLMGTPSYKIRFAFREHALEASYANNILTAGFKNVSLGDIISFLIEFVNPNRVVKFPPPWDFLNKINLSDFMFVYDFNNKSLGVNYNINLNVVGLFSVKSIGVTYYTTTQEVMFCIQTDNTNVSYEWDLLKSNSPGMVNTQNKFKLNYLAIANHFVDKDGELFNKDSIIDAVKYLTDDKTHLTYSSKANWLFVADFSINDVFRARTLFFDPHLYGIAITVDGDKDPFGPFNGLLLELLYKKITKSVGMFKATLLLPQKYRKFSVGYVTVTIGRMSIDIYTNGDFKIDMGFPHNRDFSQSFGLEFGIFSGSGGFYFGLLSGLTYPSLPVVSGGYYAPVITFGIGLSVGIGRSFDMGIVSAGFSLQAVGIFEGVMAFYNEETKPGKTYYKVKALLGLTGRVYVKVDLCVVTLSASVNFCAFAQVTIETNKPTLIALDLELTLKATIKILFVKVDFEYHLSFHKNIQISGNNNENLILNNMSNYISEPIDLILNILPYFSLCENGETHKYVLAFIPIMSKDDFTKIFNLLIEWVKASPPSADIDYECINEFLSNNVNMKLKINTQSENGNEISGVVFAMPPDTELCYGDKCLRYWIDNIITEEYIKKLQRYFNTFDLEDSKSLFKFRNTQMPIAEVIFADYFNMLLRYIRKSIKEDKNEEPNVDELAAMVSRFMLQGLRLPEQQGEQTLAFFDAVGQQFSYTSLESINLKIKSKPESIWLKGECEAFFSLEQIKQYLPDRNFSWTDKVNITPMDSFMPAIKTCSISEQLQLGENVLYRFGNDISKFVSPIIILDDSRYEVPCVFGVLYPIEIWKTEDENVYSVIGLEAKDREKIIPLFQAGNNNYKLLYSLAAMDGKKDTLIDILVNENDKFIRHNLTRETRMFVSEKKPYLTNNSSSYVTDLKSVDFLRMLWQCSVVCGGYYLYLKPGENLRIPNNIFSDEGKAKIWLYVSTNDNPNCATSINSENYEQTATIHDSGQFDYVPTLAAGCFGAKITFDGFVGNYGFNIFSYNIEGENIQSRPLIPVDEGYGPIWPLHKLNNSLNPYDAKEKTFVFKLRDVLGNFLLGEKLYTAIPNVSDFVIGIHELPCTKLTWEPIENSQIKITLSCSTLENPVNSDCIAMIYRALCQADYAWYLVNDNQFVTIKTYLEELLEYAKTAKNIPNDVILVFTPKLDAITQLEFSLITNRDITTSILRAKRAISCITPNVVDNIGEFAKKFEQCFSGYKLARTGIDSESLYAIRIGEEGLSISVSPYDRETLRTPLYYAFRPLCNHAITRLCDGYLFADIDIEVWAKHILEDIDYILSPVFVSKIADSLELAKLIEIKELFAQNISKQLIPIEQNAQNASIEAIQSWILEHLRVSLSGGYETSSIAQYKADFKMASSPARLSLNAKKNGNVSVFFGKADTLSDILCVGYRFTSKYHTGEKADFEVNAENIELDIKDVDDGYQTSKWLQMVCPLTCSDISLASDLAIPNPLRQVPKNPEIISHVFKPTKIWYELDYHIRVKTTLVEQDVLFFEIIFDDKAVTQSTNTDDLFTAMARYETVRLELLAAIREDISSNIAEFNTHAQAIANRWGKIDENVVINSESLKFNVSTEYDEAVKLHITNYDTSMWTIESDVITKDITLGMPFEFDIIIKNLPLYKKNVATPKLYCIRNSRILGDLTINSDFIYKTEEVSLPVLYAFSENRQLDCGFINSISETEVLQAHKLISNALGFSTSINCNADIVVRYQYKFKDSTIRLPLCMFLDINVAEFETNTDIASAIVTWHNNVNPILEGAALEFEFKVNIKERPLARFTYVLIKILKS